ncbi:MAG: SAM-dependent methyltransferase [Nitrosomonadales bacterium]|nr:SAM-dependent methyltransferase [Nitrosomonadales bacterium]
MRTPLPTPSPEAALHSNKLRDFIHHDIAAQGGWIPFSRFMELALYAPGLGYYSAGARKFGAAGDFVTAPEISPLFGRTLARQVAEIMAQSAPHITELGAGSGKLAADILAELEQSGCLPESYAILEVSADLRERQQALLQERVPHLAARVHWLDALPENISGALIANEVLDALPVHLVHWPDGRILERGVASEGKNFAWQERLPENPALLQAAQQINVPDGYLSEISLTARGLIGSLCERLNQGVLLFIDYGFGAGEYYHPQRSRGTLMCHYRHHAHDDPFFLPGLQDITAHVDFTAVAESAIDSGAHLLGYTPQAHFLINCGIAEMLQDTAPENLRDYLPLSAQLQKLTSPAEMGELFKVMALGKGIEEPLRGFISGDKSRLL